MPFEASDRDPREVWLGEASAVLLADALRAAGMPALSRTERVRAFEDLNLPPEGSLSYASLIRVGQLVAASDLDRRTLRVSGDRPRARRPAHSTRHRARAGAGHRSRAAARSVRTARAGRPSSDGTAGRGRDNRGVPGADAAARGLRELHQGTGRRAAGDAGEVPAGRAVRVAELRSRPAGAVGHLDIAGRSRAGAGRGAAPSSPIRV